MKINSPTCEPSSLTGTDERKEKSNFLHVFIPAIYDVALEWLSVTRKTMTW